MMKANRIFKLVFLFFLFTGFFVSHSYVSKGRIEQPAETKRAQALALDPTILRIVSGPFKGLMADYLNLKASVFMGGIWDATPEDWEAVYTLLKQSLYLDPLFFQPLYRPVHFGECVRSDGEDPFRRDNLHSPDFRVSPARRSIHYDDNPLPRDKSPKPHHSF